MWEPTVAGFLDEFPSLRSGWKRSLIYIGSCFIAFLGGISMCFPSGTEIGFFLVFMIQQKEILFNEIPKDL